MKVAKAATGARRYNMGTSNAPTRGKVNPSGYIQREIRNRNQKLAGRGNDGKSDRRSGLAQAALNNASKYAGWRGPGKRQDPRMKAKPLGVRPGGRTADIKIGTPGFEDIKVGVPQGEVPSPHGGSMNPGGAPSPFTGAPALPNIKINANGQLDLPFDEAFGLDLVDQQQSMNAELMDLQQEQQMQALEYANRKRQMGLEYEDLNKDTLNQNAARGTAFSSQYGVGLSNNARSFNSAMNDLDSYNTLANTGFNNQRMGIQNAFNDYVRQAVLRRTMDLAAEAGDLGFGTDAPNSDWMDPESPEKYPGNAQHNKPTLKKPTPKKQAPKKSTPSKSNNNNKSSGNKSAPAKKSSPIKKLKKR